MFTSKLANTVAILVIQKPLLVSFKNSTVQHILNVVSVPGMTYTVAICHMHAQKRSATCHIRKTTKQEFLQT